MTYRDPAESPILCPQVEHQIPLLSCIRCKRYPCSKIKGENLTQVLEASAFTNTEFIGFEKRRYKMYILGMEDGSLRISPNFDINTTNQGDLDGVECVYVVSKVYRKQTKLVLKTVEERAKIREELSKQENQAIQPKRKTRNGK